ncbi:MAG TPA: quinoprotein dehydrogenase-associated putative ABC transporter substrate-binding protein [Bryobacteraceae bacterium]|jgi:mxaJ protein|nr:quinoprotein dehydrogenase-associated putative ABC transporter substrate-binding protein [Bryobacteraceae bacterium]
MFFRSLSAVLLSVASVWGADGKVLRVCADPNNLPFSNQHEQGFENRIVALLASDMGVDLRYTWWPERKSLVEDTLGADRCDVLPGAPAGLDGVTLTQPYYTSTYVFVSRPDITPAVTSLNDSQLANLRIGIHIVGDDYAPPARALARRGIVANLHGYSLFGTYGEANPPERLIKAVATGDVDVAIVWGPFAGYFGPREKRPLKISPVLPPSDMGVPFTYSISMAVKQGNSDLRDRLNAALRNSCAAVGKILDEFGVPRPASQSGTSLSGGPSCEPSTVSPYSSLR